MVLCLHSTAAAWCRPPRAASAVAPLTNGRVSAKELAVTITALTQVLAVLHCIPAGLFDRSLLMFGLVGAVRRGEIGAIGFRDVEQRPRRRKLTLPHSKCGGGVVVCLARQVL